MEEHWQVMLNLTEIEFVTSIGIKDSRHLLQHMDGGYYFLLGGGLKEKATSHIKHCKFVELRAIEITEEILEKKIESNT